MKFLKVLLVFFAFVIQAAQAQSVQDVFSQKQLTWYGLDFSQAKFIGEFNHITYADPKSASEIRDVYFKAWNDVIINEPEKYNLGKFFKKDSVPVNLTPVSALNAKVKTDELMVQNAPEAFSNEKIQGMVRKYDAAKNKGLGLVFIVESFDKTRETGTINLVFFDIASGKVLLTKKVQAKPRGFGIRNYWAGAVHNAMQQGQMKWKSWEKEAGGQAK